MIKRKRVLVLDSDPYNIRVRMDAQDLSVILHNMWLAKTDPDIGFLDAQNLMNDVVGTFRKRFNVSKAHLESALWCCQMLHEKGKFWHPDGATFDQFLIRHGLNKAFNRKSCTVENEKIEKIKEEENEDGQEVIGSSVESGCRDSASDDGVAYS